MDASVDAPSTTPVLEAAQFDSYLSRLEGALLANTESRQKHAEQPELFYPSEAALYELVVQLAAAAVDERVLQKLGEERSLALLLQILAHPNGDVGEALVGILLEITDFADTEPGAAARHVWNFVADAVRIRGRGEQEWRISVVIIFRPEPAFLVPCWIRS